VRRVSRWFKADHYYTFGEQVGRVLALVLIAMFVALLIWGWTDRIILPIFDYQPH